MNAATTKLDHALAQAALGFPVFPLKPNDKTPLRKGWKDEASWIADDVRAMWADAPDANIGVYTGKHRDGGATLVIDVDVKHEKSGGRALAAFEKEHGRIPTTRRVDTTTGGWHLYLRVPKAVKHGVNVLGVGVDTRSRGGYAVGVGSTIGGRAYTLANDAPIADAPRAVINKCGAAQPERAKDARVPMPGIDNEHDISRAVEFLKAAPAAIEGEGGDATTFEVLAHLKDLICDKAVALALADEHYNPRCLPEWPADGFEQKFRNAYAHGHSRPGSGKARHVFTAYDRFESYSEWDADKIKANAHALRDLRDSNPDRFNLIRGEWDIVWERMKAGDLDRLLDAPPVLPPKRARLFYERFGDVRPNFNQRELVADFLDHGAMGLLYGDSNTGKTFVALDLAHCVASGRPWHGRTIEPGGVLYIAAEGGSGARRRIAALRKRYGDDDVPLLLVPCGVDLFSSASDADTLARLAREAEAEVGVPIALVVIDTLARAIAGGNENTAEDMGTLIGHVDALRASTGAHVLIVHHSGKDSSKGARGSSSLRAAVDTELEVADGQIVTRKQRDKEFALPVHFRLESVAIGHDPEGRPITSAVALPRHQPAGDAFAVPVDATAQEKSRAALEHCMATAAIAPSGRGIPPNVKAVRESTWRAQCRHAGLSASSEYRAKTDLIKSGAVKRKDGWIYFGPKT